MLMFAGLFDQNIRESREMVYQYGTEYIFDSSKFERAFDFTPHCYADGVKLTAESCRHAEQAA